MGFLTGCCDQYSYVRAWHFLPLCFRKSVTTLNSVAGCVDSWSDFLTSGDVCTCHPEIFLRIVISCFNHSLYHFYFSLFYLLPQSSKKHLSNIEKPYSRAIIWTYGEYVGVCGRCVILNLWFAHISHDFLTLNRNHQRKNRPHRHLWVFPLDIFIFVCVHFLVCVLTKSMCCLDPFFTFSVWTD